MNSRDDFSDEPPEDRAEDVAIEAELLAPGPHAPVHPLEETDAAESAIYQDTTLDEDLAEEEAAEDEAGPGQADS